MSLRATYQAFLASPSSGALADTATLNYITTLLSLHEPTAIIKHLATQEKLLKKKQEKVLSAIEGDNGLSLEVETTIEFVAGGGAFLPGLDDNFLVDRTATFPIVHIVHFDADQKIVQIRQHWDQGSLLKQLEVIGARARHWPIRDGKDQAKLIASSEASVIKPGASAAPSRRSTASRGPDDVAITERPISSRSSTSNAMNDPHATLNLFEQRDVNHDSSHPSRPAAERVQSAKPPPRDLNELFVGGNAPSPSPADRNASPSKGERIPVKSGGGKNFGSNRLFDDEEPVATPLSVKTNSKKYNHFEFGEGEGDATPKVRETARAAVKSHHSSTWDFEDFVTPEKTKPKILGQAVRHFGWSDDEDEGSPVRRPVIHKPRPDADAHFEFTDDGTPAAAKKEASSKGRMHNKGLGLYKDHVLHSTSDDEGDHPHEGDVKRPLGDVTTAVKNENRKKDFGSSWEMNDQSPGPDKTSFNSNGHAKIPGDHKKVLKGMDANWGLYEQSPEQSKKENVNTRGIKTAGNGMGGRKDGPNWSIGGEDDGYVAPAPKRNTQAQETKGFWDF